MSVQHDLKKRLRDFIVKRIDEEIQERDISIGSDGDLPLLDIDSGLIDSFGFLELIAAIEEAFDIEIDFSDKDPAEFLSLRGLVESIASAEPNNTGVISQVA